MTGHDVALLRHVAMLIQGAHAYEAAQLTELAARIEDELTSECGA